jgi:hypothetical protein
MKKLRAGCLGLVLLLLLALGGLFAFGASRPKDHVARVRASYAAEPAALFERLTAFEAWPTWNSAVARVSPLEARAGKPAFSFEGDFGSMPTIIEETTFPTRLCTRIPEDANLGFSGTWTFEVAPGATGGSVLTLTEEGHVESALMRAIGALFLDPHATQSALLVDLGRSLSETTTPERVP